MNRDILLLRFIDGIKLDNDDEKDEFLEKYKNDLASIIADFCDTSCSKVANITEEETQVMRKKLGILDGGVVQSYKSIGNFISKSHENARIIYLRAMRKLVEGIKTGKYKKLDDKTRLSSLPLDSGYNNYYLDNLSLDTRICAIIYPHANTLYDLLTFSTCELKQMGLGERGLQRVIDKVHSLGFLFINELSLEERISLIKGTSREILGNSSLSWLKGLDKKAVYHLTSEIQDEELDELDVIKSRGVYSLNELLDIDVVDLDIPLDLFFSLNLLGVKTIRDLVLHNREDFWKMEELSEEMARDLIDFVHDLGLFFADEALMARVYTEEMSLQLNPQDVDSDRCELIDKYESLLAEKVALTARMEQLDLEIAEMLKDFKLAFKEKDVEGLKVLSNHQ